MRFLKWFRQLWDRHGPARKLIIFDGDVLPLTQETLAEFLGVRRTTVTHVVCKLRASGAIRSNRRSSIEIDRPRLEVAACECYQLMCRRIEQAGLSAGMKPPGHARPVDDPHAQTPLLAKAGEVNRRTRTHGGIGQRPRDH